MIVNRYITALLVVLAATGMETQTYQQALRFALTDISYDEFIQQPEAKALEEDLLCVIKAFKEVSNEDFTSENHSLLANLSVVTSDILTDIHPFIYFHPQTEHKEKAQYGSIVIRGPDCHLTFV